MNGIQQAPFKFPTFAENQAPPYRFSAYQNWENMTPEERAKILKDQQERSSFLSGQIGIRQLEKEYERPENPYGGSSISPVQSLLDIKRSSIAAEAETEAINRSRLNYPLEDLQRQFQEQKTKYDISMLPLMAGVRQGILGKMASSIGATPYTYQATQLGSQNIGYVPPFQQNWQNVGYVPPFPQASTGSQRMFGA